MSEDKIVVKKVVVTKDALKDVAKQAITAFVHNMVKECDPIIDLVTRKNVDYGDAWQRYDIYTPLIRINDKILRVSTLSDGRKALIADEKIEDTLVDIIGYALLGLLKLKGVSPVVIITVEEQLIQNLPDLDDSNYDPTPEEEAENAAFLEAQRAAQVNKSK
jgi:hypothetical protein